MLNPRFMLLIIASASFMGIWSGDPQPSVEELVAAAKARRTESPPKQRPYDERSSQPLASALPAGSLAHASTKATIDLKLPPTIPAGSYRAVNHRGDVQIVDVRQTAVNRVFEPRDFYTHEARGQRWYLVRLDKESLAGASGKIRH